MKIVAKNTVRLGEGKYDVAVTLTGGHYGLAFCPRREPAVIGTIGDSTDVNGIEVNIIIESLDALVVVEKMLGHLRRRLEEKS